MKEILSQKSFKKLICLLVVIAVCMGISAFSGSSVVSSVMSRLTLGLQEVSAAAAEEASRKSYSELEKENKELSNEIAELRAQLVDYYDVKEENTRLWRYYDVKKTYPEYEILPASVLRRDPSDDFYSFTINQGSSDGVEAGDPVITDKGLVGWVYSVDLSTSKVKTVLSPDAKVGSMDIVSRDSGILCGNVLYADSGLTTMTKIPAQNTMQAGELVVTTGVSGLYPPSLIIGKVTEIKFDEYDNSKYAVIEPLEDIRTVTDVAVILSFEGQGEISEGSVEDITLPTDASASTAPAATASESTTGE